MLCFTGEKMKGDKMESKVFYSLYFDGQSRIVSQKEWEQSWLSWWNALQRR